MSAPRGEVAQQISPRLQYGPVDKLVHSFLAKEFTKDVPPRSEHLYKLSVAIAEIYSSKWARTGGEVEPFSGLLYPSLAVRGNADNICLLPEFVDTGLQFWSVDYVRVEQVMPDGNYLLVNLDHATAVTLDGSIEWLGPRK